MMSTKHPLVTFALFTYNQEKFIINALESAFAQTYSPLEVIISDDCSTDKTFELAKQYVETHKSRHKIILNQNLSNIGIAKHVRKVAQLAKGSIIIFAAGDDISDPMRTTALVAQFAKSPHAMALLSDAYLIDENNQMLGSFGIKLYRSRSTPLRWIVCNGGGIGSGATYAYRTACLSWPWKYPLHCNIEDKLIPLRAALLGSVLHIPIKLVKVRKVSTSYSHRKDYVPAICRRKHQYEIAKSIIAASKQGLLNRSKAYYLVKIARTNPVVAKQILELNAKSDIVSLFKAKVIELRRDPATFSQRVFAYILKKVLRKNGNLWYCE